MTGLRVVFGLAVFAMPLTAAADIYQWVDAEGVVHFATKPSGGLGAKLYLKTEPRSGGPRPGVVPYAPQERDVSRSVTSPDSLVTTTTFAKRRASTRSRSSSFGP
jgi:hypothetical protein